VAADTIAEPELIDLLHLGRPKVIGAWRVGEVIVDPARAAAWRRSSGRSSATRRGCWR
jgi:hypothetical protein